MQEPIARRSLQDEAADWIRRGILMGDYAPGETLTELALTERIGVGRSTVRAALFALEARELVLRTPYSSWRVVTMDATQIWEIYTLREAFEGLAARIFVEGRDGARIAGLEAAFTALAAAEEGGTDARVAADLGYHAAIVRLTGHGHLIRRQAALGDKIEWLWRWSERHWPRRQPLAEEHAPLQALLCQGSAAAAEAAMRAHVADAMALDIAGFHALARSTESCTEQGA